MRCIAVCVVVNASVLGAHSVLNLTPCVLGDDGTVRVWEYQSPQSK